MSYKVGDRVLLKSVEWFDFCLEKKLKIKGGLVSGMRPYFGNVFEVVEVSPCGEYFIIGKPKIKYSFTVQMISKLMDSNYIEIIPFDVFSEYLASQFTPYIDSEGKLFFVDSENDTLTLKEAYIKYKTIYES